MMTLDPSHLNSLEPTALATFREQAAPIVARERGLTPACRLKLAGLAQSLGIVEEQIDAAIRSLAAAEPEPPPNPQIERLRQRLRKDLAGKTRAIIGPTIEGQIIETAGRKYGLEEPLIRQVIGDVAAELGLTRITASDATQSLAAQIDKTVGDCTWLAREAWDRLRSAGLKWGLELEVIDGLIDERLNANRTDQRVRQWWTRMILSVAGGAVVLAAVVVSTLLIARASADKRARVQRLAASAAAADRELPAPTAPTWWDVGLAIDMARARGQLPGLSQAGQLMASQVADERAAGYELVFQQIHGSGFKDDGLAVIRAVVAGCYALEPDESAADKLRTMLVAMLPAVDAPVPTEPRQLDLAYWAAETAAEALGRNGASAARTAALAAAFGSVLGTSVDISLPHDERRPLQGELARHTAQAAYRQFGIAAVKEPAAVAAIYHALYERAAARLSESELSSVEAAFLAVALPAAGNRWPAYSAAIQRCVASTDPLHPLRIVDALRRSTDEQLVKHLSELLVMRAGVRPKSWSKAQVVIAVRKGLGGGSSALSAAERWLALQELAAPALVNAEKPTSDHSELLSQAVELAHLTTLAMALAQGEAGFASFDAGLAQPPQLAAGDTSASEATPPLPPPKRIRRQLNSRQQRDLGRYIGLLTNPTTAQIQRESALRGLGGLAGDVGDIPLAQAEQVASYLLAEKSAEEFANMRRAAGDLRRLKNLRLAVADGLVASKLSADQQAELVTALVGWQVPVEATTPASLRRILLESVIHDLDGATVAYGGSADSGDEFETAARLLLETYRERARLVSVSPAKISNASSPAMALELSLGPLGSALRGSRENESYLADLPYLCNAMRHLARDELGRTVAFQRVAVELSSRRAALLRPHKAAAARHIETEWLAAFKAADNALVQLRDQEASLLKLWLLDAPES